MVDGWYVVDVGEENCLLICEEGGGLFFEEMVGVFVDVYCE